jgi:hypothetical protein
LSVFGIFTEDFGGALGSDGSGVSKEDVLDPVMKAVIDFRNQIKALADQGKVPIMKATDDFRDDALPFLGIRLMDKGPDKSVWNLEDPAVLLKERQQKLDAKLKKEEEKRKREAEALKKKSTPGKDLFTVLEAGDFT